MNPNLQAGQGGVCLSTEGQRREREGVVLWNGVQGRPEERSARPLSAWGSESTPGWGSSFPASRAPPTLSLLGRPGSHGVFPRCQPGPSPAGQGPGRVVRKEGSGAGPWGTGGFSGLAAHCSAKNARTLSSGAAAAAERPPRPSAGNSGVGGAGLGRADGLWVWSRPPPGLT